MSVAVDFANGQPHDEILLRARELLAAHGRHISSSTPLPVLNYDDDKGHAAFRALCAQQLSARFGKQLDADAMMLTNGASGALALVARYERSRHSTKPICWVDSATYHLAIDLLEDADWNVVDVPHTDWMNRLEVVDHRDRPLAIYIVPTHANPTGVTLDSQFRQKLIDMVSKLGVTLICDNAYDDLGFSLQSPPPFGSFESSSSATVFDVFTFSKTIMPGLRLGLIVCPRVSNVDMLLSDGTIRSGGGLSPLSAELMMTLLGEQRNLFDAHIASVRKELAERCTLLCDALDEAIVDAARAVFHFVRPQGGYFVWLHTPNGDECAKKAAEQNIRVVCGRRCSPGWQNRAPTPTTCTATESCCQSSCFLRLCFASMPKSQLSSAAKALMIAIQ
eukprot:TRINITY_DN6267_c0_g1_i1.p1 TRINITY_DN6267_c0_g1~~TRINITY_DN6267_c0_g1_i1.p1  ORF type:complete len:406 (-),score=44.47 TRINITY_DN6267_c0_g1_i1:18-1193(-)